MILIFHILSALSSVFFTSYVVFRPSNAGLKVSAALFLFTLISGSLLMVFASASILRTCLTGLVYLAFVSVEMLVIKKRLALN